MMGALSPGLKRHSVSLFEGGRVSGAEVMAEMVRELWASYEAGQVRAVFYLMCLREREGLGCKCKGGRVDGRDGAGAVGQLRGRAGVKTVHVVCIRLQCKAGALVNGSKQSASKQASKQGGNMQGALHTNESTITNTTNPPSPGL